MKRFRLASIVAMIVAVIIFLIYIFIKSFDSEGHIPKISMDSQEIVLSVKDGDKAILEGVTATDKEDGDVTKSLIVESRGNLTGKSVKKQRVTIVAFDSDNHTAKAARTIKYKDYYSPVFTLSQEMRFPVGTTNILSAVGAQDVFDGDISGRVKISDDSFIDTERAGKYPVEFNVSNSAGDVSKLQLEIKIFDPADENMKPQIVLNQGLVNVAVGEEYNPWKNVKQITVNGRKFVRNSLGVLLCKQPVTMPGQRTKLWSRNVNIESNVNYNKPGKYKVIFSIESEAGVTGRAELIVMVHK